MHIDAVAHADQVISSQERLEKSIEREKRSLYRAFIEACGKCDANKHVLFAPMVTDREAPISFGKDKPKRTQRLHEIMSESFEYVNNGPDMSELMQLVLNVAYGSDLVNAPAQARRLLERAADAWAYFNADVWT